MFVALFVLPAATRPALLAQDVPALEAAVRASQGRVLVGLKPVDGTTGMAGGRRLVSDQEVQTAVPALQAAGLTVERRYALVPVLAGRIDASRVAALLDNPAVEYVEADRPRTPTGLSRAAREQRLPWGIASVRAEAAWNVTSPARRGSGIRVGIIDSGGDPAHLDLAWAGGYDAVRRSTSSWDDSNPSCGGHGTHVAGTVAALDNDIGVVGVAPDVELFAIRVSDQSPGCPLWTFAILDGLDWAVANGIRVVNMSLGSPFASEAEEDAMEAASAAGVVLVAASGNDDGPVSFPAAYPDVIAVGAIREDNQRASFSNFGALDVVAPGVDVLSTLPGGLFDEYQGTSMASPHVAGVAALVLAHQPALGTESLRAVLAASAVDLGQPGYDILYGHGRVDALGAVNVARGLPSLPDLIQTGATGTCCSFVAGDSWQVEISVRNQGTATAGAGWRVRIYLSSGEEPSEGDVVLGSSAAQAAVPAGASVVVSMSGTVPTLAPAVYNAIVSIDDDRVVAEGDAGEANNLRVEPISIVPAMPSLQDGQPVTVSGAAGSKTYYRMFVPEHYDQAWVYLTGGTGDADLYLAYDRLPSVDDFDCAPLRDGNEEQCFWIQPEPGYWYVLIDGFTAYSGATLVGDPHKTAANRLTLSVQPSGAVSGMPLVTAPLVQLRNDAGNVAEKDVLIMVFDGPTPESFDALRGDRPRTRPRVRGSGLGVQINGVPQAELSSRVGFGYTNSSGAASFPGLVLVGQGSQTLSFFTGSFRVSGVSAPVAIGAPNVTLLGATPVSVTMPRRQARYFVTPVNPGDSTLTVRLAGGSGDGDIYVRRGGLPTLRHAECVPYLDGNEEECVFEPHHLATDSIYVMVHGFDSVAAAQLSVTRTQRAAARALAVGTQPGGATSGAWFTQPPTVRLKDGAGNFVNQAGVSVLAFIAEGTGSLEPPQPSDTALAAPFAVETRGGEERTAAAQPASVGFAATDATGTATFPTLAIFGTGTHRLHFQSGSLVPVLSAQFSVAAPTVTNFSAGTPVTGLSGDGAAARFYRLQIPQEVRQLEVSTSGGTGDVDLFLRHGAHPSPKAFHCRPFRQGNEETCLVVGPPAGDWFVMLQGFGNYSGVTLAAKVVGGVGPASVPVWVVGDTVPPGSVVKVPVYLDLSGYEGKALGAFNATLEWDPAVLGFTSITAGDFQGSFNPNTADAATGRLVFAGINTDQNLNHDTTKIAEITFEAASRWGRSTGLDLTVLEVVATDFTTLNDQVVSIDGEVLLTPGSLGLRISGEATVGKEAPKPYKLRMDLRSLDARVGAVSGLILVDPDVLLVDSLTVGSYGGTLSTNRSMQTDSGFVRFAVANTEPPTADSLDLLTLWLHGVGEGGSSAVLIVSVAEMADADQFDNLLPFIDRVEGLTVTVTTGFWGDPNKDKLITALDALVCLSHVVGKALPAGFDASFCDVAPDGAGGGFTGAVTALDALAILSHVVGKTLPSTFRVGKPR